MTDDCVRVRGEVAEALMLGRSLPEPLARHVATCAGCARDTAELREVAATFAYTEGGPRVPTPPELGPRIGARVRAADGARRTRRLVLAAAAVVVAAVVTGTVVLSSGEPPQPVALERDGLMVPHPWGTEVPITLSGLRDGETYQLVTVGSGGRSLPAGSVRADGTGPVRTRMVTAMSRDTIVALLVRDDAGRSVAQLAVAPR
ncbi:hypothetical protein [Amycolatopsis sp. NPDC001319]|uniref:hypothetical protein n=1 Tax=unclassified Amycolatopsis TaxID=2618356 RepID=UPI0036B319A7